MPEAIEVVELTPDHAADYFALFGAAFPDNPEWAACYCHFYDDISGQEWKPDQEAAAHSAAREARIRSGAAKGLLAYADGRPVGWCNVSPRSHLRNLRRYVQAIEDPADDPALIMCFVITPEFRGQGVASALVQAAIEAAGRWGSPWIEAYPAKPDTDTDGLPWTAAFYKGPLSMYEAAGFSVVAERGWWVVVRRSLGPGPVPVD